MAPQLSFPPGSVTGSSTITNPLPPAAVPSGATSMVPGVAGQQTGTMTMAAAALAMDPTKINPYIYMPSFSIAVAGSMAFLLAAMLHTLQLIKTKAWYFAVMQNGTLIVAASLIARVNSALTLSTTGATGPFIVFMVLDMVAGTLANIGTIFTYTRVMWWVTPNDKRSFKTLWSPPNWTSFLWGFLLFIGDATKMVAQNIFKPTDPLALQIQLTAQTYQFFVLAAFTFTTYRFFMMSRRWVVSGECEEKNWRQLSGTVVIAAFILTVRQIFTIVQLDARTNPLGFYSQHEWVYWVTVSFPLLVVFLLFNLSYPGNFLPREYIGFILKLKEIKKAKEDSAWPLSISPPIPTKAFNMADDKQFEVRMIDVESRY